MKPKIGDRFKLGPWTWTVANILSTPQFQAISNGIHDYRRYICLDVEDADSLDWIKEPATISKEAREEIVEWMDIHDFVLPINSLAKDHFIPKGSLEDKLDSMVRDGE